MEGRLILKKILKTVVVSTASVLVITTSAHAEGKRNAMERNVRKPAVAGQFYTADPQSLRREIESYLEGAEGDAPSGEIVAIVSPHAGYMYSGQVAAYGYSLIRGKDFETVVVIAPSHIEHFDFCSVFAGDAYLTPLGEIPVDKELVDLISSKHDLVKASSKGHLSQAFGRGEHSLEVQLPFLQVALGDFKLIAIVMGDQDFAKVQALGDALAETLEGRSALIVASTDLSHFHTAARAKDLDSIFMESLEEFEPNGLYASLAKNETEACGGGPTAAAMMAAKRLGASACRVLRYATSGDITGDGSSVVGYVSAVILRSNESSRKPAPSQEKSNAESDRSRHRGALDIGLADDDKIFLLSLARKTIEGEFTGVEPDIEIPASPLMSESRGAFVTLTKNGQLRGCIGYIEAVKPLIETIRQMAAAAAFKDWRFAPLQESELDGLEIEISVLSPIRRIDDPAAIEVGTHGLIITRGANRGLLLPQVATEWNWDRETFLRQTCVKAGLPEDAWTKEGTTIEVFSADIFSEREFHLR
jgi:AmmeMemoRadiSam system protein B/AmmeMemoRadiSam system protein A